LATIATDIAARGIDTDISHVINFDIPNNTDDYIHRIGRTGRAEKGGTAYTFVSPEEESFARAIEKSSRRKIERVRLEDFDYSALPKSRSLSPRVQPRNEAISRFLAPPKEKRSSPKNLTGQLTPCKAGQGRREMRVLSSGYRITPVPFEPRGKSAQEGWLGLPSSEEQQELKRIRLKLFGTTGGNSFRERPSFKKNSRARY
jgi:superfamily II DNA/RNA helicase